MQTLSLIIRNRENILFEGDIQAVTSKSDKGVFDILPEHSSFISIVKENITIHKTDGTEQNIKINYGIVKVYLNKVSIYLGILPDSSSTK